MQTNKQANKQERTIMTDTSYEAILDVIATLWPTQQRIPPGVLKRFPDIDKFILLDHTIWVATNGTEIHCAAMPAGTAFHHSIETHEPCLYDATNDEIVCVCTLAEALARRSYPDVKRLLKNLISYT